MAIKETKVIISTETSKYERGMRDMQRVSRKATRVISMQFAALAAATGGSAMLISKVFKDAFMSVENQRMSVASLASTITSFSKNAGKDLAGTYKQAYDYSTQLVLKMEEWNAKTVATGKNLTAMTETFAQNGILLDLNNKKQEKGFLAIANALALMTQGQNQDIQFRQEIRGLAKGEIRATNLLAKLLSERVGGELKKHVELWKKQGTLIENAGALLDGFQEGAKDLQNTWLAVGTTLETMYNRVLRGMFIPVYEDIIKMGRQITVNIMDQDSQSIFLGKTLKNMLYKGWQDIKNITESIVDIIMAFKAPLLLIGKTTGMIFDGWGQIAAILPAVIKRIKLITQAVFDSVKMVYHFGETLWNLTTLDFKAAAQSWEKTKADWDESGKKTAAAFSSGFGSEIEKRLLKYNKDLTIRSKVSIGAPELKRVISPDGHAKTFQKQEMFAFKMAEIEKNRLNNQYKLEKDYNVKIHDELLSDTEFRLQELDRQFLNMTGHVEDELKLDEWYMKKHKEIMKKENEDMAKSMQDAMAGWASGFSNTLNDMLWGARFTFKSIAESFAKMITQMMIQKSVIEPMFGGGGGSSWLSLGMKAAGAWFAPSAGVTAGMEAGTAIPLMAKGGAFPGGINTHSSQIVNKPTRFSFANGAGIMGESGPEAIMPLTRTKNGNLGVKAEGGGSRETNIMIVANDAKSFADMVERNPSSIVTVINEALESKTGLLDTIRGTV